MGVLKRELFFSSNLSTPILRINCEISLGSMEDGLYFRKKKKKGCIFCKKPMEKKDEENLILFQSHDVFVIMNKYPYNNGHLMVVPRRHCIGLDQLGEEEFQELSYLLKASIRILTKSLRPQGFNIGMNMGKVEGLEKSTSIITSFLDGQGTLILCRY